MSVGYIASILREANHSVSLLSPFSTGVSGFPRVMRPKPWGLLEQWLKYWTATTRLPLIKKLRKLIANSMSPAIPSNHERTIFEARVLIDNDANLVLISAYTMYYKVCREICDIAKSKKIPVVIGGPYFNQTEIAEKWLKIPGLSAVFGGEPENNLLDIVTRFVDGKHTGEIPGLSIPGRISRTKASPLTDLDSLPFPDYSDFAWDLYPIRIIPMMTGRGCGWGVCTFCSDVVTAAGRTFRTRGLENVLDEMRYQSKRHETNIFTFLDLKLNSNLPVWHGLAHNARSAVPDCIWTASLHANANATGDDGLSAKDLKEARSGGLVRLTTGLESASLKTLNAMGKGTTPEVLSQFIRYASEADISVRLTVLVGFPGEDANDVRATALFLDQHYHYVDRVVLNRLAIQLGTPLHQRIFSKPEKFPQISELKINLDMAMYDHVNRVFFDKEHRRAMFQLLSTVHKINRKPRLNASEIFEGVM